MNRQPVSKTIVDKLIDDGNYSHSQSVSELCQNVKRDLENMLNTRCRAIQWDRALRELDKSLLNYGISDFTGTQLSSNKAQVGFCKELEKTILQYDPRFKEIRVSLQKQPSNDVRTLQLQIEGLICAEPVDAPVTFELMLEPEQHNFNFDSYSGW